MIDTFAPLLLGHGSGKPLPCSLSHLIGKPPSAYTIAVGGVPACRSCLELD